MSGIDVTMTLHIDESGPERTYVPSTSARTSWAIRNLLRRETGTDRIRAEAIVRHERNKLASRLSLKWEALLSSVRTVALRTRISMVLI
jgi:hypothetical protein